MRVLHHNDKHDGRSTNDLLCHLDHLHDLHDRLYSQSLRHQRMYVAINVPRRNDLHSRVALHLHQRAAGAVRSDCCPSKRRLLVCRLRQLPAGADLWNRDGQSVWTGHHDRLRLPVNRSRMWRPAADIVGCLLRRASRHGENVGSVVQALYSNTLQSWSPRLEARGPHR